MRSLIWLIIISEPLPQTLVGRSRSHVTDSLKGKTVEKCDALEVEVCRAIREQSLREVRERHWKSVTLWRLRRAPPQPRLVSKAAAAACAAVQGSLL